MPDQLGFPTVDNTDTDRTSTGAIASGDFVIADGRSRSRASFAARVEGYFDQAPARSSQTIRVCPRERPRTARGTSTWRTPPPGRVRVTAIPGTISLLILSQRPDATHVAGYRTWQSLGRQVCKGARGITIFAPCRFKREVERDNGETDEREGVYFRAVHVFDVGQTDGKKLPDIDVPTVDMAADRLLADLQQVAGKRGIAVSFQPIESGAFGVSKGGSIEVDDGHATGQQAKTLAHELAHEVLHKADRPERMTRNLAELEAESVAYVVCRHFSLETEVRSSRYIALWDGDAKALRASLERISKTARDIIDDLESLRARKAVA